MVFHDQMTKLSISILKRNTVMFNQMKMDFYYVTW